MQIYSLVKQALDVEYNKKYYFRGDAFKLETNGILYYNDGIWTEISLEDSLVDTMIKNPEEIESHTLNVKQNNFYYYISGTSEVHRKRYRLDNDYSVKLANNYNLFKDKKLAEEVSEQITELLREAQNDA